MFHGVDFVGRMILFGKQICKYKKKKQYTNFFSFFQGGVPQKVLSFFVLWSQGSYIAVPCDASRFFRQHRLYLPLHPRFTLLYVVHVHIITEPYVSSFYQCGIIKPKSVVRIYLFEISSGEYICITT